MNLKRMICATLSLCLLAGTLAGCGGGGKQGGGDKPMGRFIEEQGQRLDGITEIYQFYQQTDGGLVFYAKSAQEEQKRYTRNVLPKGGTTVESTDVAWIPALEANGSFITDISENQDGMVYVLLMDGGGGSTLYRSQNGGAAEAVAVPDWSAPASDGGNSGGVIFSGGVSASMAGEGAVQSASMGPGKTATGIIPLPDGFLACMGQDGVSRYDTSGKLVAEFAGTAFRQNAVVSGDLLLMNGTENQELWTYDLSKNEQAGTYTYEGLNFGVLTGLDAEGLYLADATGIYRQTKDGSIWERLVEGDLTSLSMPDQRLVGLTSDGSGGFYGIMSSEKTHQIMHYVYSAETPTSPDTELSIFGLKDNNTVRQAIGEFQRQNPNVRVNFRAALGDDSSATAEDVIRSLNTELLAGKGPDLILLDGLPINYYIEKGVLADMSGLVDTLVGQGVMPNLMNAYERDGKKYGVPSRFGFPVMMGETGVTDQISSLANLVRQVEQNQGGTPPLLRPSDNLWQDDGMILDYYSACAGSFLKDGAVDEAALTDYFTNMAQLNKIMREKTPQLDNSMAAMSTTMAVSNGAGFELANMGAQNLASGLARFHTQDLSGLVNMTFIATHLSGIAGQKLETLFGGDSYQPMGGVGIVSSGTQQELAQSFVKMLLSQTVQDKYLYDGFAVSAPSLEKQVGDYLKESGAGDMGFLDLCKGLATPILLDQVVEDAVAGQAKALADGTITPAEAAANVMEKTKIYLSE